MCFVLPASNARKPTMSLKMFSAYDFIFGLSERSIE